MVESRSATQRVAKEEDTSFISHSRHIQASFELRKVFDKPLANLGDPSPCSIKALVLMTRL